MNTYRVIENDRMYNRRRVIAAHLNREEAMWIQILRYQLKTADPFLQFAIETEITRKWGEDV